jgi:hypothetical protein
VGCARRLRAKRGRHYALASKIRLRVNVLGRGLKTGARGGGPSPWGLTFGARGPGDAECCTTPSTLIKSEGAKRRDIISTF